MCGACEENCRTTQRLTPLKTIRAMRERFIKDGGELLPAHKEMFQRVVEKHNPFGMPHRDRFKWLTPGLTSPINNSEVVYFVGCTMSYKTPELALATSQILAKFAVKFSILDVDEWCCGAPLIRLGLIEQGNKMLNHCITALEKTGISKVIFSDPGCYTTFKNASLFGCRKPSFEMQHITEFLLPIIEKQKKDLHKVEDKITYHDPSFLSRYLRIYEEPRKILRMIPGIELVEMFRNRLNTYCSGGEVTVKEAFPELSVSTAKARLSEAQAVRANTVVCADPNDYRNFRDAETNLNIKDLVQVLLESLEGVS
jgi:heterodisulfide reductase subunit D